MNNNIFSIKAFLNSYKGEPRQDTLRYAFVRYQFPCHFRYDKLRSTYLRTQNGSLTYAKDLSEIVYQEVTHNIINI